MRSAWVILAAAVFLIGPSIAAVKLTSLRVGTNSPASAEAVLQPDVELIYIAGGTLAMQALVGRSLDFMPQLVDLSFLT